jgi:hypothetical protein
MATERRVGTVANQYGVFELWVGEDSAEAEYPARDVLTYLIQAFRGMNDGAALGPSFRVAVLADFGPSPLDPASRQLDVLDGIKAFQNGILFPGAASLMTDAKEMNYLSGAGGDPQPHIVGE